MTSSGQWDKAETFTGAIGMLETPPFLFSQFLVFFCNEWIKRDALSKSANSYTWQIGIAYNERETKASRKRPRPQQGLPG